MMQAHKQQKPLRKRAWRFMNQRLVVGVFSLMVYGLIFGGRWG